MLNTSRITLATLLLATIVTTGSGLAFAQDESPIPEPSTTVAAVTDTTYPSDVENVSAEAGNQLVTLRWNAATDDVNVTGYKLFYGETSVSTDAASYTMGPVDLGNVLTYDVKNLTNGKAYYFAITAYDAAGNESQYYSSEVSAVPSASAGSGEVDKTAPTVVSATAPNKSEVRVVFSEAVVLPAKTPETAFSAKDDFLGTSLAVTDVVIDDADPSGKTVLLSTAEQKKSTKYILTVGIQVKDLAGNPIVSGTSDTASFTASTVDKPATDTVKPAADETPADAIAPTITGVVVNNPNTIEVTFSEPVVLLTNAAENFIITDFADSTKITNVTKVTIGANGTKATLATDPLEAKKYNLILIKVKDLAGNTMDVQNSATTFDGPEAAAVETPDETVTPPTDSPANTLIEEAASDLVAKAMANMMANLSWKSKEDKMASVANFVLYMSTDRGVTYGDGVVLAKDIKSYNFENLKSDMIYYFKLTTKDVNGQESKGLVTMLTLPATGPELAFLLLFSGGAGAFFTRKKKK